MPLNENGIGSRLTATGISPADFPLGSPQSRAAARALLSRRNALSQYDADALILYRGEVYLNACMSPDSHDLAATAAYSRGKELYEQRHGPPVLFHLDPHLERFTQASVQFKMAFGREPRAGDVLLFEDVQLTHSPAVNGFHFGRFIEAWRRRIPELPCPLKFEDGKVFERREPRFNNGQEWEEATDYLPEWNWRWVEAEAKGMKGELPEPRNMPTIAGVVFLGLVDGKHQCRPATEDEIRQARPEPSGGILGLLAKAAARIQGGQ
jgi:hypothetical protein